jgi:hypothetical protein
MFTLNVLIVRSLVVPVADDFARHILDIVSQARQAMAAAQQRQKAVACKRCRHLSYAVGDKMILRADTLSIKAPGSRKLLPKLVGPFPITELTCAITAAQLRRLATSSPMGVAPMGASLACTM